MRGISVTYFVFILYICVWVYWGDGNKFMYVCICCIYLMDGVSYLYLYKSPFLELKLPCYYDSSMMLKLLVFFSGPSPSLEGVRLKVCTLI